MLAFIACKPAPTDKNTSAKDTTHIVTCNNVHLRTFPNFNAPSIRLLNTGDKIKYIKQSCFKEKIKLASAEPIEPWIYCDSDSNQGWMYGGCIQKIPNQDFQVNTDQNVYLANRVVAYDDIENTTEPANQDTKKCFFSSESDCGGGDLIFIDEKRVISTFYCCCSTDSYLKGQYSVMGNQVVCNFSKEKIIAEADGNDSFMVHTEQVKPTTLTFQINFCDNGMFYLHRKTDTPAGHIYGVFSPITIQETIKLMQLEKVWDLLR